MRYMMRQKIFSLRENFTIKDQNERDVFCVTGKLFSFAQQLSFTDLAGNELLFIKQKLMSFTPTYELYNGDKLVAIIRKELFSFFKCNFDIEVFNGSNIRVEGDFFEHEYSILKNNKTVARISKEWFAWTDKYGIEIADDEDHIFILACAIVIDMSCHNGKN